MTPTHRSRWPLVLIAAAVLLPPVQAGAQSSDGSAAADTLQVDLSHIATAPRGEAVRTEESIQVDGRLDEGSWSIAPIISEFTQLEPEEGVPVSQRTEVRILYDDDAVYVGATLFDTGRISTLLARRDASMSESDVFAILLDSRHDHQTAYRFATNPSGMKYDEIISSGGRDTSWDPVWDVAAAVHDEGWTVEMRIPFSQLRFSPQEEQLWGLQLERVIHRNQEEAVFAFTPLLERSGVHRFGHLEGIRGIRSDQRLELLPYLTGRAQYLRPAEDSAVEFPSPYRGRGDLDAGAGLDLKYRVGPNLTLDATINPDFGQVEVDPAVINLTAFETRFQERRPFFVEGAEIFRFGEGAPRGSVGSAPEVLYPRRIGRSPQGPVPAEAVFAQARSSTSILGAAKLTGRMGDGWSVGLLDAVTARETTRFVDSEGAEGRAVVEPASNYLVGRLRRDLRGGDTRVGAILTSVYRDLSDPVLRGLLHSSATTLGLDLVHQWADRSWAFNASVSPSYVTGEPAALLRTQRASRRYFQRPDAGHVGVDTEATSLTGYYAMGMVEKFAGAWTGRLGLGLTSPGYEVNDLGFQTSADRIALDTHLQYNQTTPGRYFRNWTLFGGPNGYWNYDGDYLLDNTNLNGRWQWANYWGGSGRISYSMETLDDRLTRGGPLAREPASWQGNLSVHTDSRSAHSLRGTVRWSTDEAGAWDRAMSLDVTYKPRENWEFQVGPEFSRSHVIAQYLRTAADERAQDTYGHRYVFAGLDQTTLGVETRMNVTFTPALSLQVYAQPFFSSGRYEGPMELAASRSFEFVRYGEDGPGSVSREEDGRYRIDPDGSGDATFYLPDPDFNLRSLRGNAVLRWEWRAGSTLYLVWQQHRAETLTGLDRGLERQRPGQFELGREVRELRGIRPDNIFALKLTYWLNP
jgi:hypothetical protein